MTSTLDSPRRLSKLEAVNLILNAYGITSVASVTASTESNSATEHLIRALQSLAHEEYWFLTKRAEELTPDADGIIYIGETLIDVVPTNESAYRDLVVQDGKLFDRDENTFVFDGVVYANVTRTAPFDNLPQVASWYCAVAASLSYLNENRSGDPSLPIIEKARLAAKEQLEAADSRRRGTLVDDNPHFARHRGRARSHRGSV